MDLQELVHGHLRDVLKAAKRLESEDGDPERGRSEASVHKIRVLVRRLDALFGLFQGLKDDRKLRKALRGQKKLRKRLGSVRELDVHRAQWKEWADGRPVHKTVEKELLQKRHKALGRVLDQFDLDAIRRSVRRMEKAVAGRAPGPVNVRERLDALVGKILKDRDLHEVRLDVKRLRYSLEELAALRGREGDGGGELTFLKGLQAELGRLNDLHLLAVFLRKLGKKRADRWDRATAAAVEKAADDIENGMKTERRRWDKLWPGRRKKFKEFTS